MRTILVSAYACEPLKGSEQGVGWNWVLQMAKKNNLHVITRANNQVFIEEHLPKEVENNIVFHYYDTHNSIKGLKNKAKGLYFYYFCWQLGIIPLVKKLIKEQGIDYSMHLTLGSLWMPTFLPFFKTPFIWGPVGGGEGEPNSFLKKLPIKQRILQYFRIVMNKLAVFNPLLLISFLKAEVILVRTVNTLNVIPSFLRPKGKIILETSMASNTFDDIPLRSEIKRTNKNIRIITTGRLTPSKNILSSVIAISLIPENYLITFSIIGSGSELNKIKNYIDNNNLSHRVKLIPEISRVNVLKELIESDIFVFPSLREGGSWALMEAMAAGLPVVCLDWTGMGIITDDSSAIRLPVTNPEQMPKDLASAICKLMDNPELRKSMGDKGKSRISNVFNWEAKGEFIETLLDELDSKKSA